MTTGTVELIAAPSKRARLRRVVGDRVTWGFAYVGLAAVVAPIVWVLWGVISRALPGWNWSVLVEPGTANGGGLRNEILGSLLLMGGTLVLAGGIGVIGGIYLAEYARGPLGHGFRGASDVLAGVPSIVMGYVGYVTLVVAFGWGFSLAAGLITLAIMTVPYVTRGTEIAMRQVPPEYADGARALGFSPFRVLTRISLKSALPGIVTGILLALAISVGETAPLLYTAGYAQSDPTLALTHQPVPFLTYAVWTFYNQPSQQDVQLSYDAALILLGLVIVLIVVARLVVAATQRNADWR